MIFMTSDPHWGHANIIKYCSRPQNWAEIYIRNWKRLVKNDDHVIILGDVGFGSGNFLKQIIDQLPGKKYTLIGNHDKPKQLTDAGITIWDGEHGKKWSIDGNTFVMIKGEKDPRPEFVSSQGVCNEIGISHEPYPNIRFPYFYGHLHNGPIPFSREYNPYPLHLISGRNLSVEVTNYTPIPLPILLYDKDWLDKNWKAYFMEFFALPK